MSAIAWRTRLLVVGVALGVGVVAFLDGRGTNRSLAQEKKDKDEKKADPKGEKKKADQPEKPEKPKKADEDQAAGNPLETAQFFGVARCKACHAQPTANYRD